YINNIRERDENDVPTSDRQLAGKPWPFCRDRFFYNLHQNLLVLAQHIADFPEFIDIRFECCFSQHERGIFLGLNVPCKSVERSYLRPQVKVMQKCVFFITNVDKGRVESGNYFLYRTQINIT